MKGLVLASLLALASPIVLAGGDSEPQLPAGISCPQVRSLVAEHGYLKALVWARGHGYSWKQIAEAKKCLRVAEVRDDGRYAQSPLKSWFDGLKSGKGPCCSVADGRTIDDPDWDSQDGHYRVRIDGQWIDVPDDAVITEPNRAGRTMAWPLYNDGHPAIRCFMPGSMT